MKEYSQLHRAARALVGLSLACIGLPVLAQPLPAELTARDTDLRLELGFMPDPRTRTLTAGGSRDLSSLGAQCTGYFGAEETALVLDYTGDNDLGIFASAALDTTMLVIDSSGAVHCNDNHSDLPGNNPGIHLSPAPAGKIAVLLGSHSPDTTAKATLVITEYGPSIWANLDFNTGYDQLVSAIAGSDIDFGDDSGAYANDGECDDPRFIGDGSAMFPAIDHDGRDASDCQVLFGLGEVQLVEHLDGDLPNNSVAQLDPQITVAQIDGGGVVFGDNSSNWAYDGECDDPRFEGDGMAASTVAEDRMHDAYDCRELFESGAIRLRPTQALQGSADVVVPDIDFGDNDSVWANDGECDDPRFHGPGMAATQVESDRLHDANDCRELFASGSISLREDNTASNVSSAGIDFGDDSGDWARDGECDDPRFAGDGMAAVTVEEDIGRDATDCRSLFESGSITLAGSGNINSGPGLVIDDIDFGDDSSSWANDGECDDPRFAGDGVAAFTNADDIRRDASDCSSLYQQGSIRLQEAVELVAQPITVGEPLIGSLSSDDGTGTGGGYADLYSFNANPGQSAVINLRSPEFDTFLRMTAPDGEEFSNDDFQGNVEHSQLSLDLDQSGSYQVEVSSFGSGETGGYSLQVDIGTGGGQ